MRKLKIIEHISLDGVIQHSSDDGDFPYSDWTAPYRSPAGRDAIIAAQGERFDLLLGRRTYDLWSGFWPKAPSSPMADRLNAATKYVATHRPKSLEWGPFEGLGCGGVADKTAGQRGNAILPYLRAPGSFKRMLGRAVRGVLASRRCAVLPVTC